MKKVIFIILLLSINTIVYSQESEKYFPLLNGLGIEQTMPFGTKFSDDVFVNYDKNRKNNSKIKDNKYVSSLFYFLNKNKTCVYAIRLDFKKKEFGIEFINNIEKLSSKSETYTHSYFVGAGMNLDMTNIYTNIYYKDFIIRYESPESVYIYNYNYGSFLEKYDEFEKTGLCKLDDEFKLDCGKSGYSASSFVYFAIKPNKKTISFQFNYNGKDWMFANKVIFLLGNGNTIEIALNNSRDMKKDEDGKPYCNELCVGDLTENQVDALLQNNDVKFRVVGDKFNQEFLLNPFLIASLRYAKKCYVGGVYYN
ncbi:MAG: hypothetical protein FWD66_10705 [Paludibacter sp.]|nr:hypothetical protein [Paludibacter sp.]